MTKAKTLQEDFANAAEVLDQLAAERLPKKGPLLAAAQFLKRYTAYHTVDRNILDACEGLDMLAHGGILDLDHIGRARAGTLAHLLRYEAELNAGNVTKIPRRREVTRAALEDAAICWDVAVDWPLPAKPDLDLLEETRDQVLLFLGWCLHDGVQGNIAEVIAGIHRATARLLELAPLFPPALAIDRAEHARKLDKEYERRMAERRAEDEALARIRSAPDEYFKEFDADGNLILPKPLEGGT